jgi:hypothetical protein
MSPLAHAGHWTGSIIYLAPVLIVVVWLQISTRREKRRESTTVRRRERAEGASAAGDHGRADGDGLRHDES